MPRKRRRVELGQDHSVELERLVEGSGRCNGVLPGHCVTDKKDLVRLDLLFDLSELGHQAVINVQPAGRVKNQRIATRSVGLDQGLLADRDRVGIGLAENRDADLGADDLELLDGRRALQVGGDQHRLAALRLEQLGQLAAGGRLARALKATQHQDSGSDLLEPDRRIHGTHQIDQLVVHDLDDLLLGTNALDQLRAGRLAVDPGHQILDNVEMNVGLEQRATNLAQTFLHIRFGQNTAGRGTRLKGRREAFLASRRTSVEKYPADHTLEGRNSDYNGS